MNLGATTNHMNQLFKLIASTPFIVALVACGGGGGGDDSPTPGTTPATTPATKYTQADIQSVAAMGASSVALGYKGGAGLALLSAFLVPHTSRTAGSEGTTVRSCGDLFQLGAGTYSYSTTKSTTRRGFGVGDQLTVTFKDCKFNGSEPVVNGTAIYAATTSLADLAANNYDYPFDVMLIGLTVSYRGINLVSDGVANMHAKFLSSGNATLVTQKLTVPLGQTMRLTVNGQVLEYGGGASFIFSENSQPSGIALNTQLDGAIKFARAGQSTALVMATPTPLTGSADTQAVFTATAGTVAVKDTVRNMATSTTLNGTTASISGDTDGNGSLDLIFNSSGWAALTEQ